MGDRDVAPGRRPLLSCGVPYTCPHCQTTSHNPNDARTRYCARCKVFEDDVLCPNCPRCGQPPGLVLLPAQAFCDNPQCDAFSWNRMITAEANGATVHHIDLSGLEQP